MSQFFNAFRIFCSLVLVLTLTSGACTPTEQKKPRIPGDVRDLQFSLQNFHKDLRWGRYDHAVEFVDESFKYTFLGRYEEMEDDLRITDLTVKSVEMNEDYTIVEVEQEWYKESELVVRKERFIERWVEVDRRWLLKERLERDEYRERKKLEASTPDDTLPSE